MVADGDGVLDGVLSVQYETCIRTKSISAVCSVLGDAKSRNRAQPKLGSLITSAVSGTGSSIQRYSSSPYGALYTASVVPSTLSEPSTVSSSYAPYTPLYTRRTGRHVAMVSPVLCEFLQPTSTQTPTIRQYCVGIAKPKLVHTSVSVNCTGVIVEVAVS